MPKDISEERSFSRLVGVDRLSICWGRLLTFLVALLAAGFVASLRWIIVGEISLPASHWIYLILSNVALVGVILLIFRFIRNIWGAAALAAVAYAFASGFLALILISRRSSQFQQVFGYTFFGVFFFVIGLSLAVRHIRPLWFALISGYFLAILIDHFVIVGLRSAQPGMTTIFTEELITLLFKLTGSVAFGGLFWQGLKKPWSEWEPPAPRPEPEVGLVTPTVAEFEKSDLVKTADLKEIWTHLRSAGVGSIIFGIVAFALGVSTAEENPVNAVLAVIGFLLFLEGIWMIASPRPKGLIADGIALITIGVWNMIVTIANVSEGGEGFRFFFILGIWQIVWGVQSINRYKHFADISAEKPSKEALAQLDSAVQRIMASSAKDTGDIVEFKVKTVFKEVNWKGKLMEGSALFVGGKKAMVPVRKGEVKLKLRGDFSRAEIQKAILQLGTQKFIGTISTESLERLRQWNPGLI
jgi:hypothetical protein